MAGKKKGATPKATRRALEQAAALEAKARGIRAALPGAGHNGGPRLRGETMGTPAPMLNVPYSGLDAGSTGRRLARFRPRTEHVNALISKVGTTVLSRSRWLVRNNPYAMNAVSWWRGRVVGAGIVPTWGNVKQRSRRVAMQDLWKYWTDYADADGNTDFYGLQALAAGEAFAAGECFVRMRLRRPEDGLPVPLQLQVLPAEMLDPSHMEDLGGGAYIQQGIEFDAIGRRVAYHFWRRHPGDGTAPTNVARDATLKTRVPAEEVCHICDRLEAGQVRGLPRLSSVIVPLFQLAQYDDAEVERKKTRSMLTAFVKRRAGDEGDPTAMGSFVDEAEQIAEELAERGTLAVPPPRDGTGTIALEPGAVFALDDGEEMQFVDPGAADGGYEPFQFRTLTQAATGAGVPYFAFTGDTTKANYSSARIQLMDTKVSVESWQWRVMVFQMCRAVAAAWVKQAILAGALDGLTASDLLDRKLGPQLLTPNWNTPQWTWADPYKDTLAEVEEVKAGFALRSDKVAARGQDPEDFDRRRREEMRREERLGVSYGEAADATAAPASTTQQSQEDDDTQPSRPQEEDE